MGLFESFSLSVNAFLFRHLWLSIEEALNLNAEEERYVEKEYKEIWCGVERQTVNWCRAVRNQQEEDKFGRVTG